MNDIFVHSQKSRKSSRRRKSHSHINPKQAAELRKVSKQNSERARRARIAEKIVELHDLALSIIGQDAGSSVHMKKAEMLNSCHEVLSGLRNLLEENPKVKARFRAICSSGRANTTAVCQGFAPSHIPVAASASILSVSNPQDTPCDSGVCDLPASTPTFVEPSHSFENSSVNPTDFSVQPKESKDIWRPYLHCL
ncbi:hypothetical protein TcWFU_002941 [Taenia crassiceps]|uniref:BHLH domain-containing protein n=1 Tax=Taenia crassiceps TaxID=6207 RepID=A0ABR4QGE5_9CEST